MLERYLLLNVKALRASKSAEFKTTLEFVKCFKEQNEQVQCLLCELYMHKFFLEDKLDSNPVPFNGDIQFQDFLSFATNQIKWAKAYNTFQKREYGTDLWVRGEPTKPLHISVQHEQFMKRTRVMAQLGPLHTDIM